ncbi:MAG: hypothetical protein WCK51_00470 [Armatimonadota bacterium]
MKILLLLLASCLTGLILADEEPLNANRPNFTTNALLLAKGEIILEFGTTFQHDHNTDGLSGPEAVLRLGRSGGTELDFTLPNFSFGGRGIDFSGFGDSSFYLSKQLSWLSGWDTAAGIGTSLPLGQADLTSNSFDTQAYFSASRQITKNSSITMSDFAQWKRIGTDIIPAYSIAMMLSQNTSKNSSIFVEWLGTWTKDQPTTHTMHLGKTFAHNHRQQADFHLGRTFEGGAGGNWFFGAGYAVRL